jgi:hypothetical protein
MLFSEKGNSFHRRATGPDLQSVTIAEKAHHFLNEFLAMSLIARPILANHVSNAPTKNISTPSTTPATFEMSLPRLPSTIPGNANMMVMTPRTSLIAPTQYAIAANAINNFDALKIES